MKQFILTFTLITALCFSGFSQEVQKNTVKRTPEQKAETEAARATKKLMLNDKQKAIYKQFVMQRIATNKPVRQKLKTSTDAAAKEALNNEIKTNRDKFRINVNAMLNPEQQFKWAEMNKRQDQKVTPNK